MAMRYMLDTNICIYIAKQHPLSVLHKFERLSVGDVGMSVVTYGELLYGAEKSSRSKASLRALEELTSLIPPLPMSTDSGHHYGVIRRNLEKQGKIIGNNDLWIAAHALSLRLILVSNNLKEFSRIAHLKTENWVTSS